MSKKKRVADKIEITIIGDLYVGDVLANYNGNKIKEKKGKD